MSRKNTSHAHAADEEFIEKLIQSMTLDEKIAQTISISPVELTLSDEEKEFVLEKGELPRQSLKDLLWFGIGSLQLPGKNLNPYESAVYRNVLQKHLKERTRLGIPAISQEECLNGHLSKGSTMFPRPIGMAGSFDIDLTKRVYSAIAEETRSRGGHQAFTPVLDMGRDPRWGRIEETFGEDTFLVSEIGAAAVEGLQGSSEGVAEHHIVASPKHFVGYAQVDGGRNFAPTQITTNVLHNQILPPFRKAVTEKHALGIMPSHSEIDGTPCHGNHYLLTELLRDQWGFEGIVVSDYNDVERLSILHHIAPTRVEAASIGLRAGVDMDLPAGSSFTQLKEAIRQEPDLESYLDQAVRRILQLKARLGLFETPFADPQFAASLVNCKRHKDLALEAAENCIILLKNTDRLLPLNLANLQNIAVIGPTAHPVEFSYYSERPNVGTSILDGILEKADGHCTVRYAQGCHITKNADTSETELEAAIRNPQLYTFDEEKPLIDEAAELARSSDVAIVCLGGSPNSSREAVTLDPHYGDNASLDLVGQQNALLTAILETETPTIVVLINGKPLSCGLVYEKADAVLEGWYLGQETGHAIANVLFGQKNPCAKLPVTIARSSGHLPSYYSQKRTGFLKGYLFEENEPYFWFGYGLSYTEYQYNNIRIDKQHISEHDTATVSVDVTNTGDRAGDEIVQMYITDCVSSVTRPERELKGFKKVHLNPGETQTVSFAIDSSLLSFINAKGVSCVEPGEFLIMIGPDCRTVLSASLFLTQ